MFLLKNSPVEHRTIQSIAHAQQHAHRDEKATPLHVIAHALIASSPAPFTRSLPVV